MKKAYAVLFSLTVAIISGIIGFNILSTDTRTQVTFYEITPQQISENVECTGKIESQNSEEVFSKYPCIAKEVLVKPGDVIKKGDIIYTVDIDATREVIATSSNIETGLISASQLPKEVRSETEGKVSLVNVAAGEITNTDEPCIIITKDEEIQVQISIPEGKLKELKIGQKASISGPAFPKDDYKGELTYLSEFARQQYSGTTSEVVVDGIITLYDKDEWLRPGLSVKSSIEISVNKECLIVPYTYVMQDDLNQEFVYVFKDDRAVKKIIETGKEYKDGFEVVSGLDADDMIIKETKDIKKDGQKVVSK